MRQGEKLVVFDVETGGLTPGVHPMIQFAAVAVDHEWRELEEVEVKLHFDLASADRDALLKNRYDAEVWRQTAVDPWAARAKIADFMRRHATLPKVSARGRAYTIARLCAHNATFDCDHLLALYKGSGEFLPAACYEPVCTLALARWHTLSVPEPPKDHKLETLCAWLGIPLPPDEAHDALADVRATVQLARLLTAPGGAETAGRIAAGTRNRALLTEEAPCTTS